MIIDEILDYKDGLTKKIDLNYIYAQAKLFNFDCIANALENGNNKDIQQALINYITENEYNNEIVDFIQNTIFRNRNTKKTYYFVEDNSYGQHGDFIEEIKLNEIEYNYSQNTRTLNGKRGFLTGKYISALYYVND